MKVHNTQGKTYNEQAETRRNTNTNKTEHKETHQTMKYKSTMGREHSNKATIQTISNNRINKYNKILHSPLDVIENYGGGGARCIITEIFLQKSADEKLLNQQATVGELVTQI